MAILNLEYYGLEDLYTDGDIENKMLEIAKEHLSFKELSKRDLEFPVVYHFSEIRENILNWYPFEADSTVLEIGAGCGAITGMLCEKAGKVVSVELSKRRADINYERNKDKDNLTIMVGNLNDMVFQEAFDYIVVNGVLEYAISFTQGDTPYETFLKNMSSYLKKDGKILIAIENRLGLKYFAGAPEDHTDLHFFGIEEYPHNQTIRTFSKVELSELLKRSGFSYYKYYYPYPDYKFPTEIFTDESLYNNMYGKAYADYTENNVKLFDETVAVKGLIKEQILDRFVNSFLVVASRQEMSENKNIIYVKLNQDRKREFRLLTQIVEEQDQCLVEKKPMNPDAKPFAEKYIQKGALRISDGYENLPCEVQGDSVRYPFLKGITLHDRIVAWVNEGNIGKIKSALLDFYAVCFAERKKEKNYQNQEFCEIFGFYPGKAHYECISPANIDLICANVFLEGDKNYIIDYEWVFDFPVPVQFIMWRLLHELYGRIPKLNGLCPEHTMMGLFDIDYSDYEIFIQWTKHFVYEYAGCGVMAKHQKERLDISLPEYVKEDLSKKQIWTKLYYDLGQGLSEENTKSQIVKLDHNRFCVTFDLSDLKGIKSMRWHPSLFKFCKVTIEDVDCGQRARLVPCNTHVKLDETTTLFLSIDAHYYVEAWDLSDVKYLTITGRIEYPDEKTIEKNILDAQAREASLEATAKAAKAQAVAAEKSEAAEKISIKAQMKRIVKRALGRESDELEPVSAGCVGCIDHFNSDDQIVYVVGWAFDSEYPMENPHIAFYDKKKSVLEENYTVISRKDVADAYNNPSAEMGGFLYVAEVASPIDLDVYFEYSTPVGLRRMKLGTHSGDAQQKELVVCSLAEPDDLGNLNYFAEKHLQAEEPDYLAAIGHQKVDIIIPIYNGLKYFDALFSSLEKTKMPYRLILVDDHSPDAEVQEYLEQYKEKNPNVVLLRNEKNMGFVRSVNRGLEMAEHPVALVNTDVELPEEWLERLMYPVLTMKKVATSTPFTTCGTICSFPNFCEDNVIFENLPLWRIDSVFKTLTPTYPVMPTGVGFCMGMSIEAIREIGVFDAETFGKGYGEENDWCQRAVKAGYKNVQVDNLFVYHKHGGSFTSVEKQNLIRRNSEMLSQKHPDYNRDVAQFCRKDPMRMVRLYAKKKLLDFLPEAKVIVAFDHNLGGGASAALKEKRRLELLDGNRFITIRYDISNNRYCVNDEYKKYVINYFANDLNYVLKQIKQIDEIWVNELVTYPNLYGILDLILELKKKYNAHLKMLLHDYFPICPAINLMDEEGKYCQAADVCRCNECIPNNRSNACLTYESGDTWRSRWRWFMLHCDELIAFSDDTAHLFLKVYPELYNIHVVPHKPHYMTPLKKMVKTTDTLNIGLLGVLSYKKGLDIINDMLRIIEDEQLNIRIKLIGTPDGEIESPYFSYTGRYSKEQLPRLTLQEDIDIFLVSSICPETYSYTASEVMSMDMPVAVFPIGAPAERVKPYEKGIVISRVDAQTALSEIQDFADNHLNWKDYPVIRKKILFISEEISFASRYRVEHFQEQLICQGYASDFIQIEDWASIENLEQYHAVVLYRCKKLDDVKSICGAANALDIPVYYDIDDLVFDYEKIAYLDFLKEKEYSTFKEATEATYQCMQLCDGYLTSTNTLANEIREAFPDKPVVINRNCMSMEMQILSHDALEQTDKDQEKIHIGYFSGSKTHNKDFSIVEEVISELMEEYPNLMLKLVGVISSDLEERLRNRIVRLPFMEWQKLPAALAGVDINLMPLEDSLFHCCKSENKWTEAALVKVPSVMTRNAEMEQVITNGVNGILCTSKEEWKQALKSLIESKELRVQIAENANNTVLERYTTYHSGEDAIDFVTK